MAKDFIAGRRAPRGSALAAAPLAARQGTGTPGGAANSGSGLKTMTLDGKPGNLAQYKGKVSLVVNVASKCEDAAYAGLEKLQREMKGQGLLLAPGFLSNDFGGQEPGSAREIAECSAV